MSKIKLGVIFGGMSTEHYVSVTSATSIIKNLNKEKYEIYPIYISKEGKWYEYTKKIEEIEVLPVGQDPEPTKKIENELEYIRKLDVVFPALHGLYGEDGTIQGMLELLKIKYVGCKVLSSSICMDKAYTKVILETAGIPQAKYVYIKAYKQTTENKNIGTNNEFNQVKNNGTNNQLNQAKNNDTNKEEYIYISKTFDEEKITLDKITEKVKEQLGYPVFVKPSNSGSSVGIKKAKNEEELKEAIKYASEYDAKILIEEEIVGHEVETAVLGNSQNGTEENNDVKVACVGEILPAEEFYTFEAKYKNSESKVVIPANLEKNITEKIRNLALKAFKAVDGSGLSRVDFFVKKETGEVLLNEINTLPGFTQISMYPKLWEASGISYSELLDKLIEMA